MRILVVGHEKWMNADAIWRELHIQHERHPDGMLVAHAGRPTGLDLLTASLCDEAGIQQVVFPRNPDKDDPVFHYKVAIKVLSPHMLLAFHAYMPNSKTTKQICDYAGERDIPIKQVSM